MKLRTWLRERGWTAAMLADVIGVTKRCAAYWVKGQRFPKRTHLEAIVKLTDGQVRETDLLDGIEPSD